MPAYDDKKDHSRSFIQHDRWDEISAPFGKDDQFDRIEELLVELAKAVSSLRDDVFYLKREVDRR